MPNEPTKEVEAAARAIAFWHGQKIVVVKPREGAMTMAALCGYGSWGHSPVDYANARWREYVPAAEWHLEQIEGDRVSRAYGEPLDDGWTTITETFDEDGKIFSRQTVRWSGGLCAVNEELLRPIPLSALEEALNDGSMFGNEIGQ